MACSLPASGRHTSCCHPIAFCFFSSACNQMRVVARDAGSGNARSMMLVSSLASLPSKVSCFRRSSASCTGDCRRTMRQPTTAFLWGSDRRSKRPKSKNVLDTTMAWGDILTLMATELVSSAPQHNSKTHVTCAASCLVAIDTFRQCLIEGCNLFENTIGLTAMRSQASERIPLSVCGLHCTVTILAWVGVAVAKGDYRYRAPSMVFGAQQTAMILASFSAAVTWVRLSSPHPCAKNLSTQNAAPLEPQPRKSYH